MRVMIIVLIALGLALEELGMVAQRGAQVVKLDKNVPCTGRHKHADPRISTGSHTGTPYGIHRYEA